jgi:hypothetical protein
VVDEVGHATKQAGKRADLVGHLASPLDLELITDVVARSGLLVLLRP